MREIVRTLLDGGKLSDELKVELKKPGEQVRVVVFYVGKDTDDLSLNYKIKHLAPETISELLVYGVLMGEAHKMLQMEIEFCRGATGAFGEEKEDVMLLSARAQNKSLPTILCEEESVKGVHGASVGRIDEQAVQYLMSRGLTRMNARRTLVQAKLAQGLSKIENEKLQESVKKRLETVEYNYD